jgi:uncharacterized protein (DUF1330 family)
VSDRLVKIGNSSIIVAFVHIQDTSVPKGVSTLGIKSDRLVKIGEGSVVVAFARISDTPIAEGESLEGQQYANDAAYQNPTPVRKRSYCQRKNDFGHALDHEEYDEQKREGKKPLSRMSKEQHANDYRQDNRHQLKPEMRHILHANQADPLDDGYAEPMLEADRVKSTAQEFNSTDYQDAQKIGQNYAHYNIIAVNGVKQ